MVDRISILLYMPIYDMAAPNEGVFAILEVVVSAVAVDDMVASVISTTSDILSRFQVGYICNNVFTPLLASVAACRGLSAHAAH
jgi:hypothetical protein